MKQTVITNKRRFYAFVISMIVVFSLALTLLISVFSGSPSSAASEQPTHTVIVQAGDTVWDLSVDIAQQSTRDARDIVRDIYRLNALDRTTIQPGQSLLVPSY